MDPVTQTEPDGTVRAVVHLALTDSGVEKIACRPDVTDLSSAGNRRRRPLHRSNDPTAVTCKDCLDAYEQAKKEQPPEGKSPEDGLPENES